MFDQCIQSALVALLFVAAFVLPCAIFEWRMTKHQREWIKRLQALQQGRAAQAEEHAATDREDEAHG